MARRHSKEKADWAAIITTKGILRPRLIFAVEERAGDGGRLGAADVVERIPLVTLAEAATAAGIADVVVDVENDDNDEDVNWDDLAREEEDTIVVRGLELVDSLGAGDADDDGGAGVRAGICAGVSTGVVVGLSVASSVGVVEDALVISLRAAGRGAGIFVREASVGTTASALHTADADSAGSADDEYSTGSAPAPCELSTDIVCRTIYLDGQRSRGVTTVALQAQDG